MPGRPAEGAAAAAVPKAGRAGGVVMALASAACFSTLGLFAKLAYSEGFAIPQILAWRFTVAALALWTVTLATGRAGRPWREYRRTLLLGLFGFSPQAGLYFVTVSILDPGLTGLLLYLYPAFVVLLSAVFLRKMPRATQLGAVVLSLAGCALTLWTTGHYPAFGYFMGVVVALAYAAYLVAGERVLAGTDSVFATANVMSAAAVLYWAITLATGTLKVPATPVATAGILGMALFGTVLPITLLFGAMRRIGAADTSLVSTVEPLITIVLSAILIGERLTPLQMAGGALILAAVFILNARRPKPGISAPPARNESV